MPGRKALIGALDVHQAMIGVALGVETPWKWEARPDVWLLMVTIAAAYWWSTKHLRVRLEGPPAKAPRTMTVRFSIGLILLWVAVDWPMDRLGDDFLFSAHMAQFLLVTLIAVPLLLTGTPGWLLAELGAPIKTQIAMLSRAPVALGLFQAVLVGTHLPAIVALYTANSVVHFSLHTLWILSAGLFWLPILGKEPFAVPLKPGGKVVYLIAATVVPTVPAGFLTWANTPIYDSYATAPRVWGVSAIEDLQLAGLIMKLGGGFILWGFIAWVFITWATDEGHRPPKTGSRTPPPDSNSQSVSFPPDPVAPAVESPARRQ